MQYNRSHQRSGCMVEGEYWMGFLIRKALTASTKAISATSPRILVSLFTSDVFAMLITVMTAVNDEGGQINVARDATGEDTIPHTMQKYKARGEPWMLVVDDNCAFTYDFTSFAHHCGMGLIRQTERAQHVNTLLSNLASTAAE